ncbi:MAG: lipid-binding SYLF domain-containing protein [Syntrophobacteraceae bacterium]
MPYRTTVAILITALGLLFLPPASPCAAGGEEAKVQAAAAVIREIMEIPESAIPPSLLQNAYGIAIFPDLLKAGFIVGGRYGTGIMVVRTADRTWSNPVFFSIIGGSVGFQIGAQSTDIILVFNSIRSLDSITGGKFTLGADASIAAGPVGRHAEAGTDIQLRAEILSYSRSRGLFGGVALEGAGMQVDYGANAAFYNIPGLLPMDIFTNRNLQAPPVAGELRNVLNYYARP